MKTIKKDKKVLRVDNETADRKIRDEGFHFTTKGVWKKIRDADKEVVKKETKPVLEGVAHRVKKSIQNGKNKLAGV